MNLMEIQAQKVMTRIILKKDSLPMGLTLHLMISTNIHNTNFNRNPQVMSIIPRTPKGKPKPKIAFNKPRYNGPVYLTKYIYDMLTEEVKKELDKYNKEKKANDKPNSKRMAKSMNKTMGKRNLLITLNLMLTITILRNHILCKTQK